MVRRTNKYNSNQQIEKQLTKDIGKLNLQQWYHNLFTNFNSIDKGQIIFGFWVCWFSGWEIYVDINSSYIVINDYSENATPYWETWYAEEGFRRLIIILSILIAKFVHFFNVESHIFFLTYLRVFLFTMLKSAHLFSRFEILNTSNFSPLVDAKGTAARISR